MNIVIIGASVAGLTAAKRARRLNEKAKITLVEESKYIDYPISALPHFISGILEKFETFYKQNEVEIAKIYNFKILIKHKAIEINKEEKKVVVRNLDSARTFDVKYDKIILATGNSFLLSKTLPKKVNNSFTLNNLEDALLIKDFIEKTATKNILIFGCNYYGIMTANCLIQKGFDVTIIDKKLFDFEEFDPEFNHLLKNILVKSGIKLVNNVTVKKFYKNDKDRIYKVELSDNQEIKTSLIIFLDNYSPNVELAKKAGLEISDNGRIKVSEMLESSEKNIIIAGAIADSKCIVNKKANKSLLIIPTQIMSRVAGSVACGKDETYIGSISGKVYKLDNYIIGAVGINQKQSAELNIDSFSMTLYTGEYERFFSQHEKLHIKITVNKADRKIIGAQVYGNTSGIDKKLDLFATIIYAGLTIDDLAQMDLTYSPELSIHKNPVNTLGMRSEERRVGKECRVMCRSRWSPYH
jgi:NADPH-dependent 2,4-dienoyl-CoA reductase/sulfur reductase-like enzyme